MCVYIFLYVFPLPAKVLSVQKISTITSDVTSHRYQIVETVLRIKSKVHLKGCILFRDEGEEFQ